MKSQCQVCGKKIRQTTEPWVYAPRDVAGEDNLCYIHYYCGEEEIRLGKIIKIVTERSRVN